MGKRRTGRSNIHVDTWSRIIGLSEGRRLLSGQGPEPTDKLMEFSEVEVRRPRLNLDVVWHDVIMQLLAKGEMVTGFRACGDRQVYT
jgi:hypothetical protein